MDGGILEREHELHVAAVLEKPGARSRREAAARATELGILPSHES
ncbi:hypothetical protein [Streptomyces tauricus]